MSQPNLVAISRPDPAALQAAMAVSDGKCGQKSGNELMDAGLVIMGEACAQLDSEHKTQEDVIASMVALGLSAGVATVWVNKAHEVVNHAVNRDPEQFPRERSGGISAGEIAFYVVAVLLGIAIWFG